MIEAGNPLIVVIGLGYVGLPLAVALAARFDVTGFDIDAGRIAELREGRDRTREVSGAALATSPLRLTTNPDEASGADVYIVTVPTPVDAANRPDLSALRTATRSVAGMIAPGRATIVVYESTVYPGVTEEICGPALEAAGLSRGRDFLLGYSPERINPGDREHSIDRIVKVVAGENPAVSARLAAIYGAITQAGVFEAASIKAAEAAKAIENAQRDINIAFMNEVARISAGIGVSVWDVLAAAETKWNFLRFTPGLVGGHCIGVDPYYLAHCAEAIGHHPQVILAGRSINDSMGTWVADQLHARRGGIAGSALVLGLTFKEDVPDLRNAGVASVIARLEALGHSVSVHDPLADRDAAMREYGIALAFDLPDARHDLVFCAVAHAQYRAMPHDQLAALVAPGGLVADLKGIWRDHDLGAIDRWTL